MGYYSPVRGERGLFGSAHCVGGAGRTARLETTIPAGSPFALASASAAPRDTSAWSDQGATKWSDQVEQPGNPPRAEKER
jgi:hypothetical protein